MAYDDQKFRALFPEFSDETVYPSALISALYEVSGAYINPTPSACRMLNGIKLGIALNFMTAHLLQLQTQRVNAGAENGGEAVGFVQSASIGDVSVTRASIPAADQWQYWLNGTPYGQSLLALLQVATVGGTSLGGVDERTSFRKAGGVFF